MDETAPAAGPRQPLSLHLREAVSGVHGNIESSAGLPGCIRSLADYQSCLAGFYAVVMPLERELAMIPGWTGIGIDLKIRARTPALTADLLALRVDPGGLRVCAMPGLPGLAAALGALYVLEGSALGGKVILREVTRRLGPAVAGATAFLGGNGADAGPMWQSFKTSLDDYGARHPAQREQVVAGAMQAFKIFADGLAR